MDRRKIVYSFLLISIFANVVLGLMFVANRTGFIQAKNFQAMEQKYPLLSKRILNDFPQDLLINFFNLRKSLQQHVDPYGDTFGFYFEYLPTGTSIGINSNTEFHAASLFKLPVIMAYYHLRERTKMKDDPVMTVAKGDLDDRFGQLYKKGASTKIKASEAVRLAIVDSDNTAIRALSHLIQKGDFEAVYQGLDINLDIDHQGALISARSYASILKAIYLSAVINKDDSEHILDLLTKTKFPDKLAAGVPSNVLVAHKIGDFIDEKGKTGYRDCGIVYVPRRPYALCMYSVGDEQETQQRMQAVSKIVYDFVSTAR